MPLRKQINQWILKMHKICYCDVFSEKKLLNLKDVPDGCYATGWQCSFINSAKVTNESRRGMKILEDGPRSRRPAAATTKQNHCSIPQHEKKKHTLGRERVLLWMTSYLLLVTVKMKASLWMCPKYCKIEGRSVLSVSGNMLKNYTKTMSVWITVPFSFHSYYITQLDKFQYHLVCHNP